MKFDPSECRAGARRRAVMRRTFVPRRHAGGFDKLTADKRRPYMTTPDNFPNVRTALDAIGYRAWLGIEGVKTPLGMEPSIRYDLEYLRIVFTKQ